MKKYLFWILVVGMAVSVGTLGALYAETAGPIQAGVAAAVKGEVKSIAPGTPAKPLKSGDKIFMGDKIETGADGQLQVLLLDQTIFTLGPLSAVVVDEFIYNPKNDDGKVKASMVKGVFRVVSGKVAHKKPENMNVDLPAGTIGFRGTNVAGIIDGAKTTVVLLGPVGVGRIYVSNVVNGEVVGVDIDEAGNATIIDGPNSVPAKVFQVSEADLQKIAGALGQGMTGASEETAGDPGHSTEAGSASSARGVETQDLLNLLNTVDKMNWQTQEAAQDAADSSASRPEEHQEQNKSSYPS
ncbi:MAG TPA: FecR domain-containing protein [Candidatus Omnitrophota bacterium]|nr:FecR domain-containing protein [Candidatus Omnitrophota bacterium]HPS37214.1 FecR domain-containing protein [Candidatus Omnitrophota bacterium]